MDTIYDKNGAHVRRYAKMVYMPCKSNTQVKPPMKSLFGHKPEESAKYGEVVLAYELDSDDEWEEGEDV